jgi:L-lactate dehydrogenase complex protein LldE
VEQNHDGQSDSLFAPETQQIEHEHDDEHEHDSCDGGRPLGGHQSRLETRSPSAGARIVSPKPQEKYSQSTTASTRFCAMTISLFIPCFIDQLFPSVGISVVRILEKLGHKVDFDESLVCCGQPAFNTGCWNEARDVAIRVVDRLKNAEVVVIPSGSCGAMIRVFYPEIFKGHPKQEAALSLAHKIYEFSEFLVDRLGVVDLGSRFPAKVTFHNGCHGLRELRLKQQPRQLLRHVKELTLVEMDDQTSCCGFGGTFAVKFPMISTAMGEVKCASALETGADFLVSNDSSCLMHLQGLLSRKKEKLKPIHLAEVLASF